VNPWIPGLVAFLSAVVSGVLASLSLALAFAPRAAVEDLASKSDDTQRVYRTSKVLDDLIAHVRAVELVRLVVHVLCVAASVLWIASLRSVERLPIFTIEWMDLAIGLPAAVLMLWIFGVVIPMGIANHAGPKLIFKRAGLLRGLRFLTSPMHALGSTVDEVVRRLIGVEKKDAEEEVEQEILSVVEEAEAVGALDPREAEMLSAVMRFRDLTAQQIMTPRTDVEALELTSDLGQVIRAVRELRHSRIPVYEESLDNIVGIFYGKDLMLWLGGEGKTGGPFDLKKLLRPAYFVPENKTVADLLKELMDKKVHIALVADEYGGTAGLVTIEDIVEEIFGDIKDEYEAPIAETPDVILKLDSNSAELDAAARIGDVNEALDALGVKLPTSEDYDTVGGFVVTTLGRIPTSGETFLHERMTLTVLEAKPTRVVKVKLEVKDEANAASSAASREEQGK
jgi:putative hemolysin